MFNCDQCGKLVKPNEPVNYYVSEQRRKEYQVKHTDEYGNSSIVKEGEGLETVKELKLCAACIKNPPEVIIRELTTTK